MKKKSKLAETSLDRYDWTRARRGHWAGRLLTAETVVRLRDAVAQKARRGSSG
jgi:hypothetical protein